MSRCSSPSSLRTASCTAGPTTTRTCASCWRERSPGCTWRSRTRTTCPACPRAAPPTSAVAAASGSISSRGWRPAGGSAAVRTPPSGSSSTVSSVFSVAVAKRQEIEVDGRTLSLSNLDKVLYPEAGFTKGHVIDYYTRVSPVLLPHLHGRPLTLKRYPNGVDGTYFYEKKCPSHAPDWVQTARIGDINFVLCEDLPTLVWLANLADLELHTSLARADAYDSPTVIAFDLDPGPPATIVECAEVALELRMIFEHLGMQAFPKTSGSKGMQVYVPLNTPSSYDVTRPFARGLAELLERRRPELVVSEMKKSVRGGKVFVDWSQNTSFKTTVNVYSLRARPQPTVSTPLRWEEVEAVTVSRDPDDLVFTAPEVVERVAEHGDLFAGVIEL